MIFSKVAKFVYLMLRFPVAYPGFQRGGCLRSGPIRKGGGGGGGGGGGSIRFRSDTKSVCGGGQFASGPTRKVGKENTLSLIINGYNFDQGGCSSTSHARANELN